MRSDGIVVEPPFFDGLACLAVTGKEMLVQAFIAQTADERLDQAILHRLARLDVVPGDSAIVLPFLLRRTD